MSLSDLIQKVHGNQNLSVLIDQYLVSRKDKERAYGWHPSEFVGICPRQCVLGFLIKVKRDPFSPELLRIFDVGTALHSWYQNEYFGPMGILWGKWQCQHCGSIGWGLFPQDGFCASCQNKVIWEYKEVPVKAPLPGKFDVNIVGHSDGIIKVGHFWYLLEIKTINENGFTWMKKAREKHAQQAQIYAELVNQGFVDGCTVKVPSISGILMFYVNKNRSVEKQFNLEFDPELAKAELKKPYLVEVAMKEQKFPDRIPECKNMLKKPAKDCPMVSYCFGNKSFGQLLSKYGG